MSLFQLTATAVYEQQQGWVTFKKICWLSDNAWIEFNAFIEHKYDN